MMDLIQQNFGVEAPQDDMELLRHWLEIRITYMLEHETDLLFSTLYRLDVEEQKIREVLDNSLSASVSRGLAELVIERQLQRQKTKQSYPVDQNSFYWGDEE